VLLSIVVALEGAGRFGRLQRQTCQRRTATFQQRAP
jgi:hypothetical protein